MTKPSAQKKLRKRRGSLSLVAVFLFASAAIRIGTEAGQAVAREAPLEEAPELSGQRLQSCETREDLEKMLDMFAQRDTALRQQEEAINMRSVAISLADEKIDAKLEELKRAEDSLREMVAYASTAAEKDISRLTEVYETMKPKEAAALFEEMAPEFAAGFLGRMRPEAAAGIMAGLSPQVAYTVSVVLAGRNANAPKNK
ncbi:hypothetical protein Q4525_15105 [Shimia thalassica]|uniref:MotE family protein n=1 Tax=Shimia thalassica TaxID=1715693 RepID=UPI001C0A496C|nr:hypothetical protein [Shimia thalassica]MBU2942338.1 hypothetical protein [Shimia thalassica]MDO6504266.1 hypothetical protein [Shimia thalassica]